MRFVLYIDLTGADLARLVALVRQHVLENGLVKVLTS